MFSFFKIHYLPGITSVWFMGTFALSYAISTLNGDVYPLFPMISDTGARPPTSCIFGQLLNIGSLLIGVAMYVRYRQVQLIIDKGYIQINSKWNNGGLILAVIACLGISIVGNFQEINVLAVHLLGACMAFVVGWYYLIVQTRISYEFMHLKKELPQYGISKAMFYFRLFIVVALLPLIIVETIFLLISYLSFTGKSLEWYTEEDGDFQSRLIASFTEWTLSIFLFSYTTTFTSEFKSVDFKCISMELRDPTLNY